MLVKRIFDLTLTIPMLVLLFPLFVVIAILIKINSTGSTFFLQTRIGYNEKKFKIFKFRTMYLDSEKHGLLTIGNDTRTTKIGTWLRQYKLDELPQLFNVLKGEMSLVGPRPEVPYYISFYPPKSKKLILSVPPGITDPVSIKYKNENKILGKAKDPKETYIKKILPQKIKGYENYVLTRSLLLDIKIIFQTFFAIFSK